MELAVERSTRAWRRLGQQLRAITPSALVRAALVGGALFIVYRLIAGAWAELLPFQVGLALAYVTLPLVEWLARWMPRQLAAVCVVILELALLIGAVGLLVPPIVDELTALISGLPSADVFQDRLGDLRAQAALLPEPTRLFLQNAVAEATTAARANLLVLVQGALAVLVAGALGVLNTLGFVLALLGIPTWLVAVLSEHRTGVRVLNRMLSPRIQPDFWAVMRILDRTFSTYIRGQLLLAIAVGVLTFAGFWLLEQLGVVSVRYRLVLAMIATITQLIPAVGPILGALPGLAVGITNSREATLAILALYIIVQQIQGTFIAPRVQRRSVDIHPAIVVVFLVLVSSFGLLWVLLAAPLLVVARDLFRYVYGRFGDPPRPAGLLPGQALPVAPRNAVRRVVT
ncbi:MAG TPA: AI-2E family transporter [Chloroflexota bacterium]|nr:AI-2E family transporter [Chloroflexota bacterium]